MISILYVDDDLSLLEVNKSLLEQSGDFSVDIVSSVAEAVEKIPEGRYDAILSDYQMPVTDGITFLKFVRTHFGNLPFILFTGKGREEIVIEAVNNGVDYYIQKGPDISAMTAELKHKIIRAVERQRIEDALMKSRQQLTDIINFLPDATCVIDTDGRVIAWNYAMEMMSGVHREDMIGKGNYEYAIPFYGQRRPVLVDFLLHNLPGIDSKYHHFERKGKVINAEGYVPGVFGGRGAYIWVSASLLYDSAGNVTGAMETLRDMSEMRRMKHDLEVSREMSLGFANIIPVGIYEMDLDANLTFANDTAYHLFGLANEDRNRRICILDYIVQEDRERAIRDIRLALAEPRSAGQEYILARKDGHRFPALVYGGKIIDPSTKQTTGLRGVIIDLTQKRREAQALLENEERLKLALKASNIGIWDIDMNCRSISNLGEWVNSELGYPDTGTTFQLGAGMRLVHPLDIAGVISTFYRYLKKKEPLFEAEFRARCHNGSWKRVMVRGKIIESDDRGRPVRVTGTVQSITVSSS